MKKQTNILIIVPKYDFTINKFYNYCFPPSFGYIIAALKQKGYEVDCLNLNHTEGKIEDVVSNFLDKKEYKYVMTGGIALDYYCIRSIFSASKKHKSKPLTILGGMIITTEPEVIFNDLKPDIGIIGEGEETIIELLKYLEQGKNIINVQGIIFKDVKGKSISTERRVNKLGIDELPFPSYDEMGYAEYLENTHPNYGFWYIFDHPRIYNLVGSRSCPFQCTFCYHYDKYRARSVNSIIQEMESAIKKYDINLFWIVDECIGIDKKRTIDFCNKYERLLKKLNKDVKLYCNLRVDIVDEDLLNRLKKANCFIVCYGLESYSPIVLKSMKKNITPRQIDTAIKLTLKNNIALIGSFIFGDPAETKETARETLEYWKKECDGQVLLEFVKPYPNSELYQYCLKKGIIKDKLDFIRNLKGNDSFKNMTEMSDLDFYNIKKKVLEYHTKYRKHSSPIFIQKNYKENYKFKVKCPFCNDLNCYDNLQIKNIFFFGYYALCKKCMKKYYICNKLRSYFYKHYDLFYELKMLKEKFVRNIKINRIGGIDTSKIKYFISLSG